MQLSAKKEAVLVYDSFEHNLYNTSCSILFGETPVFGALFELLNELEAQRGKIRGRLFAKSANLGGRYERVNVLHVRCLVAPELLPELIIR